MHCSGCTPAQSFLPKFQLSVWLSLDLSLVPYYDADWRPLVCFGPTNRRSKNREVLQTEFRKLRRKRAAAGCESRKIMAHLSENPSECSVRPASNRTKFSVRFCGLRQCHVHFSIVISPSTVTQCDASRQTQAQLALRLQVCFQKSSGAS